MLMKITREQAFCGVLPPWYYGLSYHEFAREVCVFHIIPINYIIQLFKNISHAWNKLRSKPTWMGDQCIRASRKYRDDFERAVNNEVESQHRNRERISQAGQSTGI